MDYLYAAATAVREETSLLPHANAGALFPEEMARLRETCPSQGMMLETLNPSLRCHAGLARHKPRPAA